MHAYTLYVPMLLLPLPKRIWNTESRSLVSFGLDTLIIGRSVGPRAL